MAHIAQAMPLKPSRVLVAMGDARRTCASHALQLNFKDEFSQASIDS
jgi:hypothetical protein